MTFFTFLFLVNNKPYCNRQITWPLIHSLMLFIIRNWS